MTNKPISAPVLPSTGYCGNLMYFLILHKCFLTTKLYFDIHCVLSNWIICGILESH